MDKRISKNGTGNELLSSRELTQLFGNLSKKALRYYNDLGIFTPAYINEKNGYHYYSIEQIHDLMFILTSADLGVPIADLSQYIDSSGLAQYEKVIEQAKLETMESIRQARRNLKNIAYCQDSMQDQAIVGVTDQYYLRYLPARRMALLPLSYQEPNLRTGKASVSFIEKLELLTAISDSFGWAHTLFNGNLLSLSSDDFLGMNYLFIELSSPPMPEITGRMIIDGGCYRSIEGVPICEGSTDELCLTCSRAGKTPADFKPWPYESEASEKLHSFTVMIDDLEKPYKHGMWSEYTKRKIAERSGSSYNRTKEFKTNITEAAALFGIPDETVEEYINAAKATYFGDGSAIRPRLMPHPLRFPQGTTCCVLPAGIYLCKQHELNNMEDEFRKFSETVKTLSPLPLTDEKEHIEYLKTLKHWKNHTRMSSEAPYVEPFAHHSYSGDPALKHWHELLDTGDFEGIKPITNTGLIPGTDLCIADSRMIFPKQTTVPRKEFQILVETDREALSPHMRVTPRSGV